jgi:hypothetical protein
MHVEKLASQATSMRLSLFDVVAVPRSAHAFPETRDDWRRVGDFAARLTAALGRAFGTIARERLGPGGIYRSMRAMPKSARSYDAGA